MKQLYIRAIIFFLLISLPLFSVGCADASNTHNEIESSVSSIDEDRRPEDVEAKALPILKEFFPDKQLGATTNSSTYAIIDNYWDLKDIYDFAKLDWRQRGYGLCGNVRDAEFRNVYSPAYFETGYIIAFAYIGSSGSFEFECEAVKSADGIAVNANCIEPLIQTTDIGAYVYLIAVDGKYSGEPVTVNVTRTVIESTPA